MSIIEPKRKMNYLRASDDLPLSAIFRQIQHVLPDRMEQVRGCRYLPNGVRVFEHLRVGAVDIDPFAMYWYVPFIPFDELMAVETEEEYLALMAKYPTLLNDGPEVYPVHSALSAEVKPMMWACFSTGPSEECTKGNFPVGSQFTQWQCAVKPWLHLSELVFYYPLAYDIISDEMTFTDQHSKYTFPNVVRDVLNILTAANLTTPTLGDFEALAVEYHDSVTSKIEQLLSTPQTYSWESLKGGSSGAGQFRLCRHPEWFRTRLVIDDPEGPRFVWGGAL